MQEKLSDKLTIKLMNRHNCQRDGQYVAQGISTPNRHKSMLYNELGAQTLIGILIEIPSMS